MKRELPWLLEYFYEDVLWWDKSYSIRKMFRWYWIFKNKKMFAYYKEDWLYFRINPFNKDDKTENQMQYERNWKTVLLPYFKVDESILEDREELENWIELSLDY